MIIFLLLFTSLAFAPTGKYEKIDAICVDMNVKKDRIDVACDIEEAARKQGVSEEWFIKGLLANAYAESSLNPIAISPGKKSFGVFQLHVNGMGSGWSREDMMDVKKSTEAIVIEAKKNGIYKKKHSSTSATKFLCKKVLRPENSMEKAEVRANLLKKLF
jgi:hypothetical protein